MDGVKIAVIGAGSAVFSISFIRDLCLTPSLQGSTVYLVDINEERLRAVYSLAKRFLDEMGVKYGIEKTINRREALRDADYVVNTALAAGHDKLRLGWKLAENLGYRFGGSLHIMHDEAFWINFYQYRLFESIIMDMLDLCPEAWYIQLANPVLAGITLLARKYPEAKIVGLCHGFLGVYHLADVLGLDPSKLKYEITGVNHFVWLTTFIHDGEDAYPLLDEWVENRAREYWCRAPPSDGLGPKAIDLYGRFGLMPIGDTCTPGGGSWPWWYHTSREVEERWRENPSGWWKSYFRHLEQRLKTIFRVAEDYTVRVTSIFKPVKSREVILPLIEALATGEERILHVNVPNKGGLVPGIPVDFEVEIPAIVGANSIKGIQTRGLPRKILAVLLRDRVAPVETELEAYENRDKEALLNLVLMDPWTRNEDQARTLIDKILGINPEMKVYYR